MADIMDYIDWRGDIGFDEVHVNEVDGLIFSQLIYVQMSHICRMQRSHTLR